jgi:hypothetical protein
MNVSFVNVRLCDKNLFECNQNRAENLINLKNMKQYEK